MTAITSAGRLHARPSRDAAGATPRTGAFPLARRWALIALASVILVAAVLLPYLERLSVLAFIAAGLPVLALTLRELRRYSLDLSLFLLPCAVAVLSAVTSLHPQVTLWYGLQYAFSALVFMAIALSMPMSTLVRIASAAIWLGLLLSIAFPAYHHVGHTGEIAFVGIFRSKNNYSFVVGVLVLLGAAQTLTGRPAWRLFGVATLALGFAFLVMGRSLGAIVAVSAALGVAGVFAATLVFHRSVLLPATLAGATLALVAATLVVVEFDSLAMQMVAVGRDPTLTGRTILWELAWTNFSSAPILGTGYRGFFVPYYPPAVEVLRFFYLGPTAAWHYHNAFFDILASTGVLGVIANGLVLLRILGLFARHWILDRLRVRDVAIVAAFAYLALRSVLEVDFTGEYGLGLFLLALIHATLARITLERRRRRGVRWERAASGSGTPVRADAPDRGDRSLAGRAARPFTTGGAARRWTASPPPAC